MTQEYVTITKEHYDRLRKVEERMAELNSLLVEDDIGYYEAKIDALRATCVIEEV